MKHTIQHDLSDEELKLAVQRALAQYRAKYPDCAPFVIWRNQRRAELGVSIRGLKVTGTLESQPGALHIQVDVPFLFRLFQGKATAAIDREARRFIDQAHRERATSGSP